MTDRDEDFYAELNDDSPPYTPIDGDSGEPGRTEAGDASGDEIEEMADAALQPMEAAGARWADWSAREYIQQVYGIDASEYDDDAALIEATNAADADDDARPENEPTFEVQGSSSALGGSGEDKIEAGSKSVEQVEAVADAVLTPGEAAEVESMNISAAQYLKNEYGVNAAWINDEDRLMQKISAARSEQ